MTDTTPTPSTTSVRVTKQDVLDALGETDPTKTNASAIRLRLGRGGNNTIQRLLDEIRAERAAPTVALDTVAPPSAPVALVDAVWHAAWTHAQASTLARIDALTQERDKFKAALDVRVADHDALLVETDELRDALAVSEEALAQQIASEGVKLNAVGARVLELEAQLALQQTEVVSLQRRLDQAAELARRDAEIKDAAHRRDREHLLDQLAELKSLLYRGASAAPAPESRDDI